jgi:hypothetical protein
LSDLISNEDLSKLAVENKLKIERLEKLVVLAIITNLPQLLEFFK